MERLVLRGRTVILVIGLGVASTCAAVGIAASVQTDHASVATQHKRVTASFDDACAAPARLATTTSSGAQVLVGQASGGAYCLIYRDANGTSVRTGGSLGGTPAGRALVLKALDTVSNEQEIVVLVPDGFNSAAIGATRASITNNVLVMAANHAPPSIGISGSAGDAVVNLADFLP